MSKHKTSKAREVGSIPTARTNFNTSELSNSGSSPAAKLPRALNNDQRIYLLEEMLENCPDTAIFFNDDPDEGPVGHTIRISGCDPVEVTAPTLGACIDLLGRKMGAP
jgi:hypothetical protein